MDVPQPASAELEVDLANLASINRHFGSHGLVRHFLRRWLRPGGTYSLLDLCTGGADLPRLMVDWARQNRVTLEITAVDFQPGTVEIAKRWCVGYPEITVVQADARNFAPAGGPDSALATGGAGGFDFVFCSLALHHFSEADAVQILRHGRSLARRAVLVADLRRGALAFAGVWLLTALLYREAMTRFDARLSVRRAFSFREFAALAERAGWGGCGHASFPLARQAVWWEEVGNRPDSQPD